MGTADESWGDAAMLVGVSGAGALAVVETATGFKATRAGYGAVKGGFKYKGGSLDDLGKAIDENQRRGSSKYAATNATTPTPTNHNTQLEKNHNTSSNMRNSLLQNIVDSETELTNPNDTTNLGGGQDDEILHHE